MAQEPETNGRATIRDLMSMQQRFDDKLDNVQADVTKIKIQSSRNTAIIAVLVSIITTLFTGLTMKILSGVL